MIPPTSEYLVPTKVMYRDAQVYNPSHETQWATCRGEVKPGLYVAGAVVSGDADDVCVRVVNIMKEAVPLTAGAVLTDLEQVNVLTSDDDESTPSHLIEIVERVDPSVPKAKVVELKQLLRKYHKAFSASELDLGWTDRVKHTIDTGNHPPARQPLRRVPIAQREIIDKHIEQLRQGIIRPAQSPFASNLVIVKKHDGTTRCCVDFRNLNAITKHDSYPLPRMDQCIDALGGDNAWFSCIDMRSSYHQMAMHERDSEKTAFICHRGSFLFTTMPMGLRNSGATFVRLMDMVMAGLTFEVCLVYLDDIVVFSKTIDEHLQRLEMVL